MSRMPVPVDLREVLAGILVGAMARYPKEVVLSAVDDARKQIEALDPRAIEAAKHAYASKRGEGP